MDPKILIKFPTRQRPEKFFKTLNLYYNLLNDLQLTHFYIVMDEDDATMNNNLVRERLSNYRNLSYVYGYAKNKIEAVNWPIIDPLASSPLSDRLCHPLQDWDILLLASDDMIPQIKGYDSIIRTQMMKHFPDMDGVLFFNDGYRGKSLNTLCILGRKWFERFGYIYYPGYVTWYPDEEFTIVGDMLNRQVYFDLVIIKHEHPDNGVGVYDGLYRKNAIGGIDKPMFIARKGLNFFIRRVLIIQPGRVGDIIICLPIAKWLHSNNYIVEWLCPEEYHSLFRNIDYVMPTLGISGGKIEWGNNKFQLQYEKQYDKVIDLSFGFGGIPQQWWNNHQSLWDSFVSAKYHLAMIPLSERWKFVWQRNEVRESALYYLLTEKYGNDYVLVHEESHTGKYIDHPAKNKIVFQPVDDFNVFDWYEVIRNAKEIHCIDSCLSNFIEVVPEFRDKDKAIYLTARESEKQLRSIYRNGWIVI
jgi:hypothetical protein